MRRRLLASVAGASFVLSACYQPRLKDCAVACALRNQSCATGLSCSNGYCTSGPACQPACASGQLRCHGNDVQQCSPGGEWQLQQSCAPPEGACFFGHCASCDPGSTRCKDDALGERCVASDPSASWSTTAACAGQATCLQGLCVNGDAVLSVAAGGAHTCVVGSAGVRCWGDNRFGQLGLGDDQPRGIAPGQMGPALSAVSLGTTAADPVVAVAAGGRHTCALLASGAGKCWGDNSSGQLGIGDGDPRPRGVALADLGDALPLVALGEGQRATAIATGESHSCALLASGQVKCWGDNRFGQLGSGQDQNLGVELDELGDNLPVVELGVGATVVALAAGAFHSCALLDGGSVKCWGNNENGQLGQGDARARGRFPGDMGDGLRPINLGTGAAAVAIAAGGFHSCALLRNGKVKCWGLTVAGRLQPFPPARSLGRDNDLGDKLPFIPLPLGSSAVVALVAGGLHSCALFIDGSLRCWGANVHGQLAVGDTQTRSSLQDDLGDAPIDLGSLADTRRAAFAISAGSEHTCALLSTGQLKCWGLNSRGQLGQGNTDDLGDAGNELGDALPFVDLSH